jgi:hypothetical protein
LDISEIPEIDNLCESMSDVSKHSDSFGLLTGDGNLYDVVPLVENCKDNDTREFITLGDMIRTGKPSKLTRRQRFFIALTLCSSQLQLHKTPWLESGLHKNHILFAKGDKNIPILDNPYISRAFAASNKSSSPLPVSDSSISNLGIMLLELCFNATFEDLEARKKYLSADGTSNPYLDLAAAMEWCNSEAAEEAGPDFADAVRWCLGQFGASAPQEENWRQELFEKVVAPLQVCHQQYEGSG